MRTSARRRCIAVRRAEATKCDARPRYGFFAAVSTAAPTKDKVAEYGLIGLVLGGAGIGAAKLVKVGLLAKFGNVIFAALIAAKKAIVLFFLGIGALFKRLFSGKKAAEPKDE